MSRPEREGDTPVLDHLKARIEAMTSIEREAIRGFLAIPVVEGIALKLLGPECADMIRRSAAKGRAEAADPTPV